MVNKKKTDKFIQKAKKIHNNKYDYSKVDYINARTKVCIICPMHGEFWQKPKDHLNGSGCQLCSRNKKLTTEEFITKAIEVHNNKYIYSQVNYINSHTKVCIICPKHGKFMQEPNSHLNGQGCPKCSKEEIVKKNSLTTEEFIEKAKNIHGDKYDYSKVKYIRQ